MKHLILFDGTCPLCTKSTHFLAKRDTNRKFTFISLQSEQGQKLLQKHHLPTSDFDSFVYIKNSHVFLRSTAALQVLKTLGGWWSLLFSLIIVPKFIRDGAYQWIAKNRHRF